MSITSFTLLVLVVYLVFLKLVGLFAYRRSGTDTEDYFLSKREVPMLALVVTTMASLFSTGTIVSSPSEFFTKGSGYFWVFFFILVPVIMMLVVDKFWKLGRVKRFVTPAQLLEDFYGSKRVMIVTAVAGLLSMIPHAAAQMVAVGKTFEALTGGAIPYSVGVSLACFAIGLYVYFGGARAVIWTDVVQGTILGTFLLVSGFLVVHWAGGWGVLMENLVVRAPEKASFQSIGIGYYEYLIIALGLPFLPYVWQRMYMARSALSVARIVVVLPIIYLALFFVAWVIGTAGITMFPAGLADGDSVLGAIFNRHAPVFGAFVLVAAFAGGMSTVDSQMLTAGSIISEDLRPLFPRKTKASSDFRFARLATLALLLGIYSWSLLLEWRSVLSLIMLGIGVNVIFVPSVLGMFYWRRSSAVAAFWSLFLGLLVLLLKEFSPWGELFPTPLGAASWAFGVSLIVFVVVALSTNGKGLDSKREEFRSLLN